MRYNAENDTVYLLAEEISEGFPSPVKGESASGETARQKYRDRLASENGVLFLPDREFVFNVSADKIRYSVYGKADGVLKKDGKIYVYSIVTGKSQRSAMAKAKGRKSLALCLCHFAASEFSAESITLRTVTLESTSGKAEISEEELSSAYLSRNFLGLLFKKERFAKLAVRKEKGGRESICKMKFPFGAMREGQRELIEECYRAIHNAARLFAEAPTGIGKTISVLYPAVKAVGNGLCDKIFYLTAKASTRREAFAAVKKMFDAGAELKVIILSSKEQMCGNAEAKISSLRLGSFCKGERCSLLYGYNTRKEDALYELLTEASGYTPSLITKKAAKHGVCPYELSLDLSEYCDVIICDYNYVFDPAVKLRRYFGELSDKGNENYVFLTDEAHNLPDRAREMYTKSIDLNTLLSFKEQLPIDEGELHCYFEEFIRDFLGLRKLCKDTISKDNEGNEQGYYFSTDTPVFFQKSAEKFLASIESYRKKHPSSPIYEIMYDLLSNVKAYLSLLDYYDEHFRTYVLVYKGNISIKAYCIDPSLVIDKCMSRAIAAVLFSATLTPTDYFADLLGGAKNAVSLSLPSPFPRENLCLCALTGISTRHSDREKSFAKIANAIAASVMSKKGNYIVYFPSYYFMEQVAKRFTVKFPKVNIKLQERGMSYSDKEHFLDFFKEDDGIMRIGFCVLGGSFSEGVDLPGSRLIGSIIVGVGLPQLSDELNIIRDFYELKYERGYDYAYVYPGMNKVFQACGRVIRRESDKGIVVLIDDRYETPQYKSLFPPHWESICFASSAAELANHIDSFWQNENNM